ncbi:hypothetical protein GCM10023075_70990 [Streptosporangium album]
MRFVTPPAPTASRQALDGNADGNVSGRLPLRAAVPRVVALAQHLGQGVDGLALEAESDV